MAVILTNEQFALLRHAYALGASAVSANYADSLIKRPYRTRGVYLKALACVTYDRAFDVLKTSPTEDRDDACPPR